MAYDSTADTLTHIKRVNELLSACIVELLARARCHDTSKLEEPEKQFFDIYTPKLKETSYGTDEYRQCLQEMKPALVHHNEHNSHHPEHHECGIDGMSLFDLIEMICDWKAAGERHADGGDLMRSIRINKDRFQISDQLANILRMTVPFFTIRVAKDG